MITGNDTSEPGPVTGAWDSTPFSGLRSDLSGSVRDLMQKLGRLVNHADPNLNARLDTERCRQGFEEKYCEILTLENCIRWGGAWKGDAAACMLIASGESTNGLLLFEQSFLDRQNRQIKDGISNPVRLIHARSIAPDLAAQLKTGQGTVVFR